MKCFLALLLSALPALGNPYLGYNNRPMGTVEKPLVIHTYLPDPGIEDTVFSHHHRGEVAPGYSPKEGRDTDGKEKPVSGLPAAIGVNFGPQLSYVFDPVECRPMYAWQGGFIDLTPYWGDEKRGSRVAKNYVPQLVGILFHKAEGKHPLAIDGKPVEAPEYVGYSLEKGVPRFSFRSSGHEVSVKITPSDDSFSYTAEWVSLPKAKLSWNEGSVSASGDGNMFVRYVGKNLGEHHGYQIKVNLSKANIEAGEELYQAYGCIGCHSTDGSKGHGPSLAGLAGSMHEIEGSDKRIEADKAYLIESIRNPNAKIAKGYPANYMPPFQLKDVEVESLVLFIQSIGKPE